ELSPLQREYADTVTSSGNALLGIINDILDFSKIEAGKLELEAIPFEIGMVVDEVADLFGDSARARGIAFDACIAGDVPFRLQGDPGRLRQILTNLVANALKFTRAGHVQLQVTSHQNGLACTVADTGVGIPADKLPRLFQPFTQADSSTTRQFGGTGLGLAICRRLAEAMGGSL
ncbi:ATP-binding protein, partial [Zoogloea sp.]|uniref:ATP-binding protein n=1 Tax=Zoogloea sp. TaxID=49181 RepID=UPI0025E66591